MIPVRAAARQAGDDVGSHGDVSVSLWGSLARLDLLTRAPVAAAFWQQVRRGALDFSGLAAGIGAIAGFFTLATTELGLRLGVTVGVRVLETLVLGHLAGFVCALLLVAGSGTATTFELGLIRQSGELRTLRLIGIDAVGYLVLPRVGGFGVALFLLTLVFQVAAAVGGAVLAAATTSLTVAQLLEALADLLAPGLVVVSAFKSIAVGVTVGLLACHHGLLAPFAPAEMPRITRRLLGRSLVALVLIHGAVELFWRFGG